ncbi:MAG: hypothetical protein DRP70_00480 [Spirochaetes bacterium]|nr:MAG: hypothetical protein DRP70_00480 [Spirochaetota bacterium]RKX98507.1 MAG: hypothetical protein DRZ90_02630 [Spirochaetota bacterium]
MQNYWDIHQEIYGEEVNFTVRWSPWGSMDRWVINRLVPSEAGLFQLWTMEGRGLVLTTTEQTYYGGLRNTLREAIDEMAPSGQKLRNLIQGRECWFRFSTSPYRKQLQSLKRWFDEGDGALNEEKREIFVQEIEEFKRFPPPPPDVKFVSRGRMKDSDFGPPMPTPGK